MYHHLYVHVYSNSIPLWQVGKLARDYARQSRVVILEIPKLKLKWNKIHNALLQPIDSSLWCSESHSQANQLKERISLDLFIPLRIIKYLSRIRKLARGKCIYNSNCIKTRIFKILFYSVEAKYHAFIVAIKKRERPLKYKIHHCIFVFLLLSKNGICSEASLLIWLTFFTAYWEGRGLRAMSKFAELSLWIGESIDEIKNLFFVFCLLINWRSCALMYPFYLIEFELHSPKTPVKYK